MLQKSIKALIWDLDGTLIHFNIDFLRARRNAIKVLKQFGVPKDILTVKQSILENINEARKYFESKGLELEKVNQIIKKVDGEVIKVEYEAAIAAEPIDGMKEVLEFAKNKGLKQAIYTFNTKENAIISLNKVGILEYFDSIVGRNNVKNPKPHPDHIMQICQKLSVTPNQIIVIGDTDRDIEGAIRVGAHSIAICTKISKLWCKDVFNKADFIILENEISTKLMEAIQSFL